MNSKKEKQKKQRRKKKQKKRQTKHNDNNDNNYNSNSSTNYHHTHTPLQNNIHVSKVHCRSAVGFGWAAALPGFPFTAHHLYACPM